MEHHGFIFTKHALERSKLRSLTTEMIAQVLRHPDQTHPTDKANTSKFIRSLRDRQIHVVATFLPEQKKWLVVSVWVRGEEDPKPIVWRLLTAPFRATWWLARLMAERVFSRQ